MELTIINQRLSDFYSALQRGAEAFEEAGRILVGLIDEDPLVKDRILEAHPDITESTLETFERIGRNQLYYRLCLIEGPGVTRLKRCTFSDQVKFSTEPIPMLLVNGQDSTDHILVPVQAMQPNQARQVFGPHRIRTLGEQRAFIESERTKPQPIETQQSYTIGKGRIVFHKPVTLTISDMARLLSEMT